MEELDVLQLKILFYNKVAMKKMKYNCSVK